jgi:hypothetical protein
VIGGSEAAKTPVAMTFDQVADLSIDSAMPIRSITVAEWLNPTPSPSGITAPWVGSLAITGRGGASGDFEGYLQLTSTAAKQNLVGGFALRIDSNRKILDNLSAIGWYRLPLDYLERWTDQVERVSTTQVRDAFQRKVRPEGLITVVVGAGEARP